jgi:hypothetical protein
MIGIVKGREIKTNKDGDIDRVLLQVEFTEDEIRTVELMPGHGVDVNPANDTRVFVQDDSESYQVGIASTDDLDPEVDPGEVEFYSTDSPATAKQARLKLDSDGNVINNQGANSAVSYAALNTALQLLVTNINALFATKLDGGGSAGTLTLDISASESNTVKIP